MVALGIVLVLLGLASAAVAIDLLVENAVAGAVDLSLFGRVLADVPRSALLIAAAVVGVGAVTLVALGVAAIGRGRRRARAEARFQASARLAGTEARHRLLEFRVGELRGDIQRLEERRDRLIRDNEAYERRRAAREAAASGADPEPVVVLPDLGPPSEPAGAAPPDGPPADPQAERT